MVTLDSPDQTVYTDFLLPVAVNFTGTISAPATNTAPLLIRSKFDETLPSVYDPLEFGSPVALTLSPGESYSGVLVTLIVPASNVTQEPYEYSGQLLVYCGTANETRPAECSLTDMSLSTFIAAPNSVEVQLDDASPFVVSELPYSVNFNGTVTAAASNNETLSVLLSVATTSIESSITVVVASIPPLSAGQSYSGVLMIVTYPPYSNVTDNIYTAQLQVAYDMVDEPHLYNGSVSVDFELTVVPQHNYALCQLDTPFQNVTFNDSLVVNFTGTITALANNTDTLYFFGYIQNPGPEPNIDSIPTILLPLSPGESYSGLLFQVFFPDEFTDFLSANVYDNTYQLQYATSEVSAARFPSAVIDEPFGLLDVPATAVTGSMSDTALLQLDKPFQNVTFNDSLVVNFTGTITALANNTDTLYFFGYIQNSGPEPKIGSLPAIGLPPLSPGQSYSGLLFQVIFPDDYSDPMYFFDRSVYDNTYQLQYATSQSFAARDPAGISYAPFGLVNVPAAGVLGDPMFVGLRGQRYQVHGLDGAVYNLISDRLLQVNARFTYLDSGSCLRDAVTNAPLFTCWTHRGSYLSALAVMVSGGASVLLTSGAARDGFASVAVAVAGDSSGRLLSIGESATVSVVDGGSAETNCTVTYTGLRTVHIAHAGVYSLVVENSDHFLNLLQLTVHDMRRLTTELHSHGLIGQTWDERTKGAEVNAVAGYVDDYAEAGGDLRGCGFVYNRFSCE